MIPAALYSTSAVRTLGVLVATRTKPDDAPEGIDFVELDELFRTSDVVSLHCPLTPETDQLVNERRIKLMKPSAFLINTSRGPLIDECALAEALDDDRIAGAALDVLATEPPRSYNLLLGAKNCIITPHIAFRSEKVGTRVWTLVHENLRLYVNGDKMLSTVDLTRGY